MGYRVKEASIITGLSEHTLRYYDDEGLVSPKRDNYLNYRMYTQEDIDKLQLIYFFRELDVPLSEIKIIINDKKYNRNKTLDQAVDRIDKEIERLNQMKLNVEGMRFFGINNQEPGLLNMMCDGSLVDVDFPDKDFDLAESLENMDPKYADSIEAKLQEYISIIKTEKVLYADTIPVVKELIGLISEGLNIKCQSFIENYIIISIGHGGLFDEFLIEEIGERGVRILSKTMEKILKERLEEETNKLVTLLENVNAKKCTKEERDEIVDAFYSFVRKSIGYEPSEKIIEFNIRALESTNYEIGKKLRSVLEANN